MDRPVQSGGYRGPGQRSSNSYDPRGGNAGRSGNRNGRGRGRGGRDRSYNNRNFHNTGHSGRNQDLRWDVIEQLGIPSENTISIAIEGCCHGELDRIYDRIARHETETGQKIDLLLCCGDFQSIRNLADFHSLAVPVKFRSLGTFYQYYAEVKVAPILTIFIGGNHEASQPLHELYYGGWVAPNIYYLGAAGVVNYKGVRIGGISGIYKSHDYGLSRHERPPFDKSTLRSVYHVRSIDVYRMKCLSSIKLTSPSRRIDIMLSHDWPQGIEQYGDTAALLRRKPFFRQEIHDNNLGSPPNRELLVLLKPKYWFAAHLHVKFKALVEHGEQSKRVDGANVVANLIPSQVIGSIPNGENNIADEQSSNDLQNTVFQAMETSTNTCTGPDLTSQMTNFLSLDKCLPKREYLSILHVPRTNVNGSQTLEYDAEWLAILLKTQKMQVTDRQRVDIPLSYAVVTEDDIQYILTQFGGSLTIPCNFRQTVQPQMAPPISLPNRLPPPLPPMGNPQTDEFLEKLQLNHNVTIPWNSEAASIAKRVEVIDDDEINIDEEDLHLAPYVATSFVKEEEVMDDDEINIEEENLQLEPYVETSNVKREEGIDDDEINLDDENDETNEKEGADLGDKAELICDADNVSKRPRMSEG